MGGLGRAGSLGVTGLGLLASVALLAPVLASELPLAARVGGRVHLLPALGAAEPQDVHVLRGAQAPGDWWVPAPIPFGPSRTRLEAVLRPPDARHWLGTDELGRDVLARMVHGARVSLAVALLAVALQVVLGVLLGGLAGLLGGWVDAVLSRLTEALLAVPAFLLVLGTLGLARASSALAVALVLGLTRWPDVARLVRAEAQRAVVLPYVEASRALGAPPLRVLVRHVLPAALAPVQVAAALGLGRVILAEGALSFLGYGVPLGTPSWGELLAQAHRHALHPGAWWLTLFPGLALLCTVGLAHLVGEALRARGEG